MNRPTVNIYTDGSHSSATNCGGWAASLYHGDSVVHLSGSEEDTTNNRMELVAVIEGLKQLQMSCVVHLYSDSQYVLNGIGGWVFTWAKRNWRSKDRSPVKNKDLWKEVLELLKIHTVKTHWVKGHNGDPYNETVNDLAIYARETLEDSKK